MTALATLDVAIEHARDDYELLTEARSAKV